MLQNEGKVRDYVVQVAERNSLPFRVDRVGNVRVEKHARAGMERKSTAVLQAHLDMVCEKNRDVAHDFTRDPIKLKTEGDWLMADGTSLGADNGLGVAAALAILESKDLKHGPLECLFTVGEETGLTGASELAGDMLRGRVFFNLDSEEHGTIYIGCSGGKNTELLLALKREAGSSGYKVVRVRVGGLQGGHSGLNINEGRGNAIKLMARLLWYTTKQFDMRLSVIDGGNKLNAIPRECEAIAYLPQDMLHGVGETTAAYEKIYKEEYASSDGGVFVGVDDEGFDKPDWVMDSGSQDRVLNLLHSLPHGVIALSQTIPGLVETSTNLAMVHATNGQACIRTSQRSSVETKLAEIADTVAAAGKLAGAQVTQGGGYPGWKPDPDSPTLQQAKRAFNDLFGEEPKDTAIHAGLECGVIGHRFPGMDMISFGPTILGAHSPDERVLTPTVKAFWDLLLAILEKLPGDE